MAELIIMPKLGFNMSEGKIVKWYKKEGETVKKGEPLFSVETDKTSIDIEATADGVVKRLFLEEGDKLPVTLPIAIVAADDENIDALLAEAEKQLGKEVSAPAKAVPQPQKSQESKGEAPTTMMWSFWEAVREAMWQPLKRLRRVRKQPSLRRRISEEPALM